MKCFIARLGYHGFSHFAVRIRLDPSRYFLSQMFSIEHHGRREDFDPVEFTGVAELDTSHATCLQRGSSDGYSPCYANLVGRVSIVFFDYLVDFLVGQDSVTTFGG